MSNPEVVAPRPIPAVDLPRVWSYEGERHGRHNCSICIGSLDEDGQHVCYATAHGKTEQEAMARGQGIERALAAQAVQPPPTAGGLRALIAKRAEDWQQEADNLRNNRGQRGRTLAGHEVLANCANQLAELAAHVPPGAVPHQEEP